MKQFLFPLVSLFSLLLLSALPTPTLALPQPQCISQAPNSFGPANNGTAFNDLTTLTPYSSQAVLRLVKIELCETSAIQFTGMRGSVLLVDALSLEDTHNTVSILGIGDNESCQTGIELDFSRQEYIKNVTYFYDTNAVRMIVLTSNLNRVVTKGRSTQNM